LKQKTTKILCFHHQIIFYEKSSFLFTVVVLGLIACKKGDPISDSALFPIGMRSSGGTTEIIDGNHPSVQNKQRILGVQYQHPFGISNMRQAFQNLYPSLTIQLTASHRYLRFLPHSSADLVKLDKSGFVLLDTPLDYEIVGQR
jgi:hypothetical protein